VKLWTKWNYDNGKVSLMSLTWEQKFSNLITLKCLFNEMKQQLAFIRKFDEKVDYESWQRPKSFQNFDNKFSIKFNNSQSNEYPGV